MGEWAKNEVRDSGLWSEEHDRLPLKQRLKILLARSGFSDLFPDINLENGGTSNLPVVADDGFVKEENGQCGSENFVLQSFPSASFARDEKVGSWSYEHNHTGKLGDCNDQLIEANTVSVELVQAEKLSVMDHSSPKQPPLSPHDVSVSIQFDVHSSSSSFRNHSNGGYLQEIKIKNDNPVDFFEELDHVVLKERRRMLVSSQAFGLAKTSLEGITVQLSRPSMDDLDKQSTGIVKKEASYVDKDLPFAENSNCEMQKTSNFISSKGGIGALSNAGHRGSYLGCDWQDNKSTNSEKGTTIQEKDKDCPLEKKLSKSGANRTQNLLSGKTVVRNSILPNFVNVKVEPFDNYETGLKNFPFSQLPVDDMDPLKSEPGLPDDSDQDNLDHMLLRERMKLLSTEVPHSDVFVMKCLSKMVPAGLDCQPIAQESSKPLRINRPRKRRKTATDSVETALEEDAPGLLQVLIKKGVSVNEIKLYGEAESDEALDDSSTENFLELEAIISQLFCRRNSLLKLAPLRCAKAEKATYCLACLFSLVEQARCIQFRKWPVEWGWCRDLQAFIFVFERHNRIVLERPEYGYATYFFELMDSLPIDWQIKRLVTAMKLTSCSRVTLIENKALVVGEDLTEGEARVLMEYGWIPNTGLGSMLNYCDRVVHDRKNEDTSDWRSKIGKLLIDGYNGGCIVPTDVPKKVGKYNFAQIPEIKMETN